MVDAAAVGEDDGMLGHVAHDLEVLLHEEDGDDLGRAGQDAPDLLHETRGQTLGRLVDEQHAVVVEEDPREGVTDVVDPRQLNVPVFVQNMDAADEARRAQRNRIHVDLFLPHDQLADRLEAALAAGGRVVRDASPIWWTVVDPEGNEVDLTTSYGREEEWAAAVRALADRGLVDDAGLTEEGAELRARLEVHTDALSADPWLLLGPERTARVVELGKQFSRQLVANGALSAPGLAQA